MFVWFKAILALELKGAFYNVTHEAILMNLGTLGCREKMYSYIKDFLSDRTAIIKLGDIQSPPIQCDNRGTPQEALPSLLPFNIAMVGLSRQLDKIPNFKHSLYADNITICIAKGPSGVIQDSLQMAADVVRTYARRCGLACAPQKSELMLVRKCRRDSADHKIWLDRIPIKPTF